MVFFFAAGRRVQVRLKGAGHFFCLYCETERTYQHREWRSSNSLYFVPVVAREGEFIRCDTCDSAFDPECLDESSTAFCHELFVDAPSFAIFASLTAIPRQSDVIGTEYIEPQWERGKLDLKSLSASSSSRRH